MATLADMKARIISDTLRPDLADAIAREITSAIKFYASKRFYFTEKLTAVAFNTVAGQNSYTTGQQAPGYLELTYQDAEGNYLPLLYKINPDAGTVKTTDIIRIDSMVVGYSGGARALDLVSEAQMKVWMGSGSPLSGYPAFFSLYGGVLQLYPIPDQIYPIVIAGVIRIAPPANDAEEDNPWMNDAEEMIRMRAESKIWAVSMGDIQTGAAMRAMEEEAFQNLLVETSARTQVDTLVPDCL